MFQQLGRFLQSQQKIGDFLKFSVCDLFVNGLILEIYEKLLATIIGQKIKRFTDSFVVLSPLLTLNSFLLILVIVFSLLISAGGNRFSQKHCLGGWVISFCLVVDDKNLGRGGWGVGRGISKIVYVRILGKR